MADLRRKATTAVGKRALRKREPASTEGEKHTLFLFGHKTTQLLKDVLVDLRSFKKPFVKVLSRKNDILPFEDATSMEFLGEKNACAFFTFANSTKKRPNNIVFGRLFDWKLYDMYEFGVSNFAPISSFPGEKFALGSKPCLLFSGDQWDASDLTEDIRNFFIDYFRGKVIKSISLKGIDHVLDLTMVRSAATGAAGPEDNLGAMRVHVRGYKIAFKKSGTHVPRVELNEIGPHLDLELRRVHRPDNTLRKVANKVPSSQFQKTKKNTETGVFGTTGRLHIPRQELATLPVAKRIRRVTSTKSESGKSSAASANAASSSDALMAAAEPQNEFYNEIQMSSTTGAAKKKKKRKRA